MIAIMSPEKVPSRLEEEIKEDLISRMKVEEEEAKRRRQPDTNVLLPCLGENSRRLVIVR